MNFYLFLRADEFVDLPCFPTPDGKFAVREIAEDLGGSATNACCGFLACGATARLHSLIGDDDVALRLLARLRHKGLDLALCKQIQGLPSSVVRVRRVVCVCAVRAVRAVRALTFVRVCAVQAARRGARLCC